MFDAMLNICLPLKGEFHVNERSILNAASGGYVYPFKPLDAPEASTTNAVDDAIPIDIA